MKDGREPALHAAKARGRDSGLRFAVILIRGALLGARKFIWCLLFTHFLDGASDNKTEDVAAIERQIPDVASEMGVFEGQLSSKGMNAERWYVVEPQYTVVSRWSS